jgi:hypothetical protein
MASGSQAVIDQLSDDFHPSDQHAQRQRDHKRQHKAAIDPAHRRQEMNVQGAAIGIVIDAAEGEVLKLLPHVIRRRDQAPGPVNCGKMPEREQRQWEGDGEQDRPQPCRPAFGKALADG